MSQSPTAAQKLIIALASASVIGGAGLVLGNTRDISRHEVRIQHVETIAGKLDTLNDKLSATNANLAALNAHLEDTRREQSH